MKSLVRLFNEWEIQILVLFSFTIQFFLFFAGSHRLRIINGALGLLIWLAYLGSDFVAAYALGLITRLGDATAGKNQLALLWVPFLLIHLGGQDTITAFSIEDNKLWKRHLLNLVVQVSLTLYIFGKSTNLQLLVPSILLFVTGTIKYGERTLALWSGTLANIARAPIPEYTEGFMREKSVPEQVCLNLNVEAEGLGQKKSDTIEHITDIGGGGGMTPAGPPPIYATACELEFAPIDINSSYSDLVCIAVRSMHFVHLIFYTNVNAVTETWKGLFRPEISTKLLQIIVIEVSLMFDDIYTKALVLRTRSGIILRCLSDISFLAAFVLFYLRNKERYNHVDIAVTYVLFIGGFFLEVSSVFITLVTPRFWAWLKIRHYWSFVASISIRWQRKRVLWSYSMGQYCLLNYLGQYDQPSSKMMAVVRKMVSAVCGVEQKFWISKLLDTKFVKVDEEIMRTVVEKIALYQRWSPDGSTFPTTQLLTQFGSDISIVSNIIYVHLYTEVNLSRYDPGTVESKSTVSLCRAISNYLVYLLVMCPEMILNNGISPEMADGRNGSHEKYLAKVVHELTIDPYECEPSLRRSRICDLAADRCRPRYIVTRPRLCSEVLTKEELLELQAVLVGILIYVASKSPPVMHAAHLARGGELVAFIWLLMAHGHLGDSVRSPFEIISRSSIFDLEPHYIFGYPHQPSLSEDEEEAEEDQSYDSDKYY